MKKIIILIFFIFPVAINAQTTIELLPGLYSIDGNLGIGINNTNSSKLAVKGNIIAEEVKVQVYPWSDFVFEDGYKLPTLAEVAQYIKDKGHLQDIPSAEEVAKNGINIGEMDAKLLQKIEELTLYILQKENRIKAQKARLEKLEILLIKQ